MTKLDKFPKRHFVLFLLCLPGNLIGWFLLLVLWLLSGDLIYWNNGLWITLKEKSWLGRSLFKNHNGGCICHGGWYKTELIKNRKNYERIDTRLERHEHIHVEQFEVINVFTFVVLGVQMLLGYSDLGAIASLILWSGCWWLFVAGSMVVAWFRGEDHYKGNINEESAYSQDENYRIRSEAQHKRE